MNSTVLPDTHTHTLRVPHSKTHIFLMPQRQGRSKGGWLQRSGQGLPRKQTRPNHGCSPARQGTDLWQEKIWKGESVFLRAIGAPSGGRI